MDELIKLIDIALLNGKISEDDYRVILKRAESIGITEEELNLIISKRTQFVSEGKGHSKDVQNSNIPYLLAIIAIVMTFFDWVGFYSTSNVLGSSASWDTSFNAWWGSYGVVVVIIYALGCFFYSKKYRFYWFNSP